ncbi:MAG: hypothetical protein EBS38_02760 [Actinobacteria bacterium]|nr:hypothetical protein [Actinomycetota bacterium]
MRKSLLKRFYHPNREALGNVSTDEKLERIAVSSGESSHEFGTEAWLIKTGGRLSILQAIKISAQGLAQTIRDRTSRSKGLTASEASRQQKQVSAARIELAKVLGSLGNRVLDRQGQAMLNHTCRTYIFGCALLSDKDFMRVNHTAAVVAALAHDDGLVRPSTGGLCFTGDSALEAQNMMGHLGVPDRAIGVARSAVISHFQPILPAASGPEAKLVALGASADVMGIGLRKIHPQIVSDAFQEWPELDFFPELKKLLKGEIRRAPRTRPGVLALSGMPYLLRRASSDKTKV